MRPLFLACLLLAFGRLGAEELTWASPVLGKNLRMELLEPTPLTPGAPHALPVVFYLTHLAAPRVGTESDEVILRDLRTAGHLVVVLDYAGDPRARMPGLARDLVALRSQIKRRTLLTDHKIDLAHIFIVPAGHRLRRDIVYYRDTKRTLALDLIYPSRPGSSVGAVLEFSCDNANRMGNYSLDYCSDMLLPGAATEGFAVAMADHPVAAPYEGLDAMPDSAWKIKAAVRTLRAKGAALGLSGRIVPAGFSRGSGLALMLVTTAGRPEFEGHGEHPEGDSSVQGAVVLSGRFTYLDLLPADHMLPRYHDAWGPRAGHEDVWRAHGALDHLTGPANVPLFLSINVTETPDALHQMDVLRRRLTALGSPFTYLAEPEARGHKVPLAPGVLEALQAYLRERLAVAKAATPASPSLP